MWPFFYNRINLYFNTHSMENKEIKKPVWKKWWFWLIVIFWIAVIHWLINPSPKTDTPKTNTPTIQKQEKLDPINERLNEIRNLYAEEPTFEKAEKFESNAIWIYFTDIPDLWVNDPVDFLARWQAVNLSNIVNGVASAKIFIAWEWKMFCIATKGQITECNDYR